MRILLTLTMAALCSASALAQQAPPTSQSNGSTTTPFLARRGLVRCGTPNMIPGSWNFNPPSDCNLNSTNPTAAYEPTEIWEITVVFHILRDTNGSGNVTNARCNSQIDILNEDFQAMAGTPGSPGYDTMVQFKLATVDPSGNTTTGINRHTNSTWHNDGGNYYNSLAWDPHNYLNIYCNEASGSLGYVPWLPQSGTPGSNSDRVVALWSAVGRNAPIGAPYNQGRTVTHEVGHYLGLHHTFNGGCGGGNCYTSGDRICDTNPESSPHFGCGNANSCGSSDPTDNYMDYSDDQCMNVFTNEQTRRMRCTLQHYRPNLAQPVGGGGLGTSYCQSNLNSRGLRATLDVAGSPTVSDNDLTFTVNDAALNQFGYLLMSLNQGNTNGFGGSMGVLCLGSPMIRFSGNVLNMGNNGTAAFSPDLTNLPQNTVFLPGDTWNFQLWYRDNVLNPTSNTTDGISITFQ